VKGRLIPLCMTLSIIACAPPPEPLGFEGLTMGTVYSVRLSALPPELTLTEVAALVDAELATVNSAMSTYDRQSELSRFNARATTDWVPASPALAAVVSEAQRIAAGSSGAFDVTAGPLVDLWGFGPVRGQGSTPETAAIETVRERVGYRQLEVRVDPPALRKTRGDLSVDLSAIAKGHGVDRVATRLERLGVDDYLVEIGGEIRTRGRRPDGRYWQVGVERPDSDGRTVRQVLPLATGALATSGDYRNFFAEDGRRYSHIIDPRTGKPVRHGIASVTVHADDCMTADGWATALSVLGPEEGLALARDQGLAALFVLRDGDTLRDVASPEFEELFPAAARQGMKQ